MLAAEAIATGGDPDAVGAATATTSTARSAATCASRRALQTILRRTARRARRDRRRRPHAVDAPQLRPLDVRGLSARAARSRPTAGTAASLHRTGRLLADSRHSSASASCDRELTEMADGKAEVSIDRSPDDVWKLVARVRRARRLDARHRLVHRRRRRPHAADHDGHRDQGAARELDDDTRRISYSIVEVADGQRSSHHLATISVEARRRRLAPHVGVEVGPTSCSALFLPDLRRLRAGGQDEARELT